MSIYVATHKRVALPNCNWLIPLGLNGYHDEKVLISDADGEDSISNLNRCYGETTGLYWLLKHCQDDYVGMFQYRRYLTFAHYPAPDYNYPAGIDLEATPATFDFLGSDQQKERMLEILSDFDFILPRALVYQQNVANAFVSAHGQPLWDQFLRSCRDELGFDTGYFKHETRFFLGNMFVAGREHFTQFATALFRVLDAVVAAAGEVAAGKGAAGDEASAESARYAQDRYAGYVAERFIGLYAHQMRLRVFEAPIIHLTGTT